MLSCLKKLTHSLPLESRSEKIGGERYWRDKTLMLQLAGFLINEP